MLVALLLDAGRCARVKQDWHPEAVLAHGGALPAPSQSSFAELGVAQLIPAQEGRRKKRSMSVASVDDRGEERIKREKSDGVDTDVEMEDVEKVEALDPHAMIVNVTNAALAQPGCPTSTQRPSGRSAPSRTPTTARRSSRRPERRCARLSSWWAVTSDLARKT